MQNREDISYKEYVELVKREVAEKTGLNVSVQKIDKNNGLVLDGLTILAENSNISPTIYLSDYYQEFLVYGVGVVADKIIKLYEKHSPTLAFDVSMFTDVEKVSPLIRMKLINYEKNKKLLVKVPHVKVLDLAVVFMVVLETDSCGGFGSILIYHQHLDFWNFTADDLFKLAKENMSTEFEITPMTKILDEIMDGALAEEDMGGCEDVMFLLTTHTRLHGAVGMIHAEVLNWFMKKNRYKKLVILPSSIHEVILVPYNQYTKDMEFAEMVKEVNATQLAEQEILSDSVYIYDGTALKIME